MTIPAHQYQSQVSPFVTIFLSVNLGFLLHGVVPEMVGSFLDKLKQITYNIYMYI